MVEIIDEELDALRVTARLGTPRRIRLAPGRYLVRGDLPSGAKISQSVTVVPKGDTAVQLTAPAPKPPDPRRQVSVGAVNTADRFAKTLKAVPPSPKTGKSSLPAWKLLGVWRGAWLRLWQRTDGWQTLPVSPLDDEASNWTRRYLLSVDDGLHVAQIGAPELPWRCISLPAQRSVLDVTVHWRGNQPDVTITAEPEHADDATLLDYVTQGDWRAAETVAEHPEPDSRGGQPAPWLAVDGARPDAAIIDGYVLLDTDRTTRVHEWSRRLSELLPWLPDGPLIHGWQALVHGDDDLLPQARDDLLEAAARGVPIYTKGLRLLWDGLRMFATDYEVDRAISRVRPYAVAADWSAPTTTYAGAKPSEPSRRPIVGVPSDANVWYLS